MKMKLVDLTETNEFDSDFYKACIKWDGTMIDIFKSPNPHILIRNLRFGKRLFDVLPETEGMIGVFQNKKRHQSLFDHSLKVLEYTYEQTKYFQTLVAAFYHDFGKIHTQDSEFKDHDRIGIKQIIPILSERGFTKDEILDIKTIMMHHPSASQYQRNPNWTDAAVRRFIRKTHPLTKEVVAVGKADKKSSHNYGPYLAPYDDLWDRCVEQFKEGLPL